MRVVVKVCLACLLVVSGVYLTWNSVTERFTHSQHVDNPEIRRGVGKVEDEWASMWFYASSTTFGKGVKSDHNSAKTSTNSFCLSCVFFHV